MRYRIDCLELCGRQFRVGNPDVNDGSIGDQRMTINSAMSTSSYRYKFLSGVGPKEINGNNTLCKTRCQGISVQFIYGLLMAGL